MQQIFYTNNTEAARDAQNLGGKHRLSSEILLIFLLLLHVAESLFFNHHGRYHDLFVCLWQFIDELEIHHGESSVVVQELEFAINLAFGEDYVTNIS